MKLAFGADSFAVSGQGGDGGIQKAVISKGVWKRGGGCGGVGVDLEDVEKVAVSGQ